MIKYLILILILFSCTVFAGTDYENNFILGTENQNLNRSVIFGNGNTNKGAIRYNYATGKITASNDAVTYFNLDSTGEEDPKYTISNANRILLSNINNWDYAFGWGDHANENYLKVETEYLNSNAYKINNGNINDWNEAYGKEHVHGNKGALDTLSNTNFSSWDGKQAAIGYTPENTSNKNSNSSLGTSDLFFPTQNAVKSYVDSGLSLKQPTITLGTLTGTANQVNLTGLGTNVLLNNNVTLSLPQDIDANANVSFASMLLNQNGTPAAIVPILKLYNRGNSSSMAGTGESIVYYQTPFNNNAPVEMGELQFSTIGTWTGAGATQTTDFKIRKMGAGTLANVMHSDATTIRFPNVYLMSLGGTDSGSFPYASMHLYNASKAANASYVNATPAGLLLNSYYVTGEAYARYGDIVALGSSATNENFAGGVIRLIVQPRITGADGYVLMTADYNKVVTINGALNANGTSQTGSSTNYTNFESDGTMHMAGNATTWEDIVIHASNLRTGSTTPTYADTGDGIYATRFDNAATQDIYGDFETRHSYKENTNLEVHIHWQPSTTNTGNANTQFLYNCANDNSNFSSTVSSFTTLVQGKGDGLRHQYSTLGTINGSLLKIGAICRFSFKRNGTAGDDDATFDMWLYNIGVHFEQDTLGSRQIITK